MFKELMKPVNFKKGILVLSLIIIFNIVFTAVLLAGLIILSEKLLKEKTILLISQNKQVSMSTSRLIRSLTIFTRTM